MSELRAALNEARERAKAAGEKVSELEQRLARPDTAESEQRSQELAAQEQRVREREQRLRATERQLALRRNEIGHLDARWRQVSEAVEELRSRLQRLRVAQDRLFSHAGGHRAELARAERDVAALADVLAQHEPRGPAAAAEAAGAAQEVQIEEPRRASSGGS